MRVELAGGGASLELRMRPFAVLSETRRLENPEREEVTEALLSTLAQQRHFALILDLGVAHPLPEAQSTHVVQKLWSRWPALRHHWAALAVLVSDSVDVQSTSAPFWLRVSPVPARVFGEHQNLGALAWALKQVQGRRSPPGSAHSNDPTAGRRCRSA